MGNAPSMDKVLPFGGTPERNYRVAANSYDMSDGTHQKLRLSNKR